MRSSESRLSRRMMVTGMGATDLAGIAIGAVEWDRRQGKAPQTTSNRIQIWSWQNDQEFRALQNAVERFNQSQSKVEVLLSRQSPALPSGTLFGAIRAHEAPDAIVTGRLVVADRVSTGLLEDLRPLLEARGIDTNFPALYGEAAASEVCLGDGIYGVPLDSYLRVQLVNKTVIAAAGMDPNEFDPDRGAMSFDRLGIIGLALHSRERPGGLKRAGFIPLREKALPTPISLLMVRPSSPTVC